MADSYGFNIVEEWPNSDSAIAEVDLQEWLIVLVPGYSEKVNMASLAHEMGHFHGPVAPAQLGVLRRAPP